MQKKIITRRLYDLIPGIKEDGKQVTLPWYGFARSESFLINKWKIQQPQHIDIYSCVIENKNKTIRIFPKKNILYGIVAWHPRGNGRGIFLLTKKTRITRDLCHGKPRFNLKKEKVNYVSKSTIGPS